MPILTGDLIPHRDPLAEFTSFWEVRGTEGESGNRLVIVEPITSKPAIVAGQPQTRMLIPEQLLSEREIYRKLDLSAEKAAKVVRAAVKFLSNVDSLGTDPRAWANAFIAKHGAGKLHGGDPIDVTMLIGWFARAFDAGRAEHRQTLAPPKHRHAAKSKVKRKRKAPARGVVAKRTLVK